MSAQGDGVLPLRTSHLMHLAIDVTEIQQVGDVVVGERRVSIVTGGHFQGERLRGTVLTGGADWLLGRSDGVLNLDVRLVLETHDGVRIGMTYRGYRHGPPEVIERLGRGEAVDPGEYYFRTAPLFESPAGDYAWLNRVVCVATGRREPTGPVYDVYEVL